MVPRPMAFRFPKALLVGLAAWSIGLLALAWALERDTPLFLNLGPGDAPFARGFRGGWERDGTSASGATTFHWTEDGARLEFPVQVLDGPLTARLRLARFADTEAQITLMLGGRVVESWTQPPRGWSERSFLLGPLRGPLMLRFRSEAPGHDPLGIALDWAEVRGAGSVLPRSELLPGLLAALLGVPLAVAVFAGLGAGAGFAVLTAWAGALAVGADRLGGLVALAEAGRAGLPVVILIGASGLMLGRLWRDHLGERVALLVPCAAAFLACLALLHPFFHYPDVDTHARFLAAIRADPWVAFDPREFQLRNGAWIRNVGSQRVAFPYAPFLHLCAWPLALLVGDAAGVKAAAAASLGATLLLAFGVARALALKVPWALLAQCLLVVLPVTTSRLTLALFPTLLGQAAEALLALHLLRRFGHLDGARDAAAAALFLFVAQAAYTGSVFNVLALVVAFAAIEALAGERRRALRLLGSYAVAAVAVALLLYARFLPVLLRDVLPHVGRLAPEADPDAAAGGAVRRVFGFYGGLLPLLALLGLLSLPGAPAHARRWGAAALLAGGALLSLRGAVPTLLRDAKEIELLALPVAVLAAAALRRLWDSGEAGRIAAVGALAAVLVFCVPKDATSYAARFVAVGR